MSDVSRSEAAIRQLLLEEITRVNQEVNDAGGWDAWAEETGFYDQGLTGDPGPVKGDPPRQAPIQPEPCLLYTSPSPRDRQKSRMPSSA